MTILLRQKSLPQVVRQIVQRDNGAWFDCEDMSTMYQDASGTTPVTALEQPVGLWLDKSQGLELGPELVSNGTFDSGKEGWVSGSGYAATITETGGVCSFTSVSSNARIRPPVITTNIGAMYTVTITILSLATTVTVRSSSDSNSGLSGTSLGDLTVNSVGTYTFMFKAHTTTTYLWVLNNGAIGTVVSLDNISVRELYGNHATQPITASRPTLSARYNLLTKTEYFTDVNSWGPVSCTVTNPTIGEVGVKHTLTEVSAIAQHYLQSKNNSFTSGTIYSETYYVSAGTVSVVQLVFHSVAFDVNAFANFDIINGVIGSVGSAVISPSISIVAGTDIYKISMSALCTTTTANTPNANVIGFCNGNINSARLPSYTGSTSNYFYTYACMSNIGGPLPYQRVNTATDYDSVGWNRYVRFDGIDDYLNLPYMGLYKGGSASCVFSGFVPLLSSEQVIVSESKPGGTKPLYTPAKTKPAESALSFRLRRDDSTIIADAVVANVALSKGTVFTVIDAGNDILAYQESALKGHLSYTRSGVVTPTATTIGCANFGATYSHLGGSIYGLIITKSALSDTDRRRCEQFLASRLTTLGVTLS